MNPIAISLAVFVCVFGGALLGMFLRCALPEHHLSADSKQIVNLGMGIIGMMAALVLGLLVASAKSSFDTQSNELTEISAKVILLDRILAHYGSESNGARAQLRKTVANTIERTWPKRPMQSASFAPNETGREHFFDQIESLSPTNDIQKSLKAQASSLAMTLGQTRWLMFEQASISIYVAVRGNFPAHD